MISLENLIGYKVPIGIEGLQLGIPLLYEKNFCHDLAKTIPFPRSYAHFQEKDPNLAWV